MSKLERAISKEEDVVVKNEVERRKKKEYLRREQLGDWVFPVVSEEVAYSVLLTMYYSTKVMSVQSLVAFIENVGIQEKIINTLIYILRDPFGSELFPKEMQSFKKEGNK